MRSEQALAVGVVSFIQRLSSSLSALAITCWAISNEKNVWSRILIKRAIFWNDEYSSEKHSEHVFTYSKCPKRHLFFSRILVTLMWLLRIVTLVCTKSFEWIQRVLYVFGLCNDELERNFTLWLRGMECCLFFNNKKNFEAEIHHYSYTAYRDISDGSWCYKKGEQIYTIISAKGDWAWC